MRRLDHVDVIRAISYRECNFSRVVAADELNHLFLLLWRCSVDNHSCCAIEGLVELLKGALRGSQHLCENIAINQKFNLSLICLGRQLEDLLNFFVYVSHVIVYLIQDDSIAILRLFFLLRIIIFLLFNFGFFLPKFASCFWLVIVHRRRFFCHTEHAALDANHFGSFAFVSSQHPSLDTRSFIVYQALLDIFLEKIFNTGCSQKSQATLDVFLRSDAIDLGGI